MLWATAAQACLLRPSGQTTSTKSGRGRYAAFHPLYAKFPAKISCSATKKTWAQFVLQMGTIEKLGCTFLTQRLDYRGDPDKLTFTHLIHGCFFFN